MNETVLFQNFAWESRWTTRSHPRLVLLVALVTTLVSAAVCATAILTPAPSAVVPVICLICVGCPIFASWQAPMAVAALRAERTGGRALAALRRGLEQLPETEHPLGRRG